MSLPSRPASVHLHRWGYLSALALVTAGAVTLVAVIPPAQARLEKVPQSIVIPGFQYLGNASCAGSKCHTADKATEQSGQLIGDENNIWDAGDPHNHAYISIEKGYVSADGKWDTDKIAAKLDIADTTASSRCVTCHAVNAPAPQRGEKFRIQSGVGCEACHGPAEKYKDPHAKAGWTRQEREKLGAAGLLAQHGLVDTTHLAVRANTCVACHLQIDKALVDAGHPPLRYDQYFYNTIKYKFWGYYDQNPNNDNTPDFTHWSDPPGVPFSAKLWATGIAASLDSAKANLTQWDAAPGDGSMAADLHDWYAAAMTIVTKHFGADSAKALAETDITAAQAKAAAADLEALAATAKSPAARWGIAQGLAAMGDIFNTGDQPFWDAYNNASDLSAQGGDAYLAEIKKLAAKVK